MTNLSKTLAFALRHHPEKFGVVPDSSGWVSVSALADGISVSLGTVVTVEDLISISAVEHGGKSRFQIADGRIRATHGHSIPVIMDAPSHLPDRLFHGTTVQAWPSIRLAGLRPMGRRMVHLTSSPAEALLVAERFKSRTVLLEVDTLRAGEAGVRFVGGAGNVWGVEGCVPVALLELVIF